MLNRAVTRTGGVLADSAGFRNKMSECIYFAICAVKQAACPPSKQKVSVFVTFSSGRKAIVSSKSKNSSVPELCGSENCAVGKTNCVCFVTI